MAPVHQLEELYRELDVANAAPPALHLALLETAPAHQVLGTRLHGADLTNCVGVEHLGPHVLLGPRRELLAEFGVARDRTRLQQRLELPFPRPPLPVRLVRLDAAAD